MWITSCGRRELASLKALCLQNMNIRNFVKRYYKKTHIGKFYQFLDNFYIYHSILLQDGKGSVLSSLTKRQHRSIRNSFSQVIFVNIVSIYAFEEPKLYHF